MKCGFKDNCESYNKDSRVCNKTGGMYYEDETQPAGCYRNKLNEIYKIKKNK